jgi:ATP-binding cassette, subfamily B (MDR/TAP), member 1
MTSIRISAALRLAYLTSLFAQPISKLDDLSPGAVANTITASSNTVQMSISDRLSTLFQSLALVIGAYAIAFRYSWALTLIASAPLLFMFASFGFTVPLLAKLHQRMDKADQKHASAAGEIFSSIRTVSSLGAEKELGERYSTWTQESRKQGLKLSLILGVQLAVMFFGMFCDFSLTFYFGLKLFQSGDIANINAVIM